MKISLSGIKPTSTPHIGNHLGMIMPAIELQNQYDCRYFIADYHAMTTIHNAEKMREYSYGIAAYFLAFGLDPKKCVFYRQSDLPQVCELTWLLSCVTSMGLLERAHAWKAAKDRGSEGCEPHGLFAYPVLMAADILIHDADVVPVGKDQIQHVEMTRDMAERFNFIYGNTLHLPTAIVSEQLHTIPGLDGRKMSKSYDNTINLMLPPKKLKQQIMSIVTDSTPIDQPKDHENCNVFALYKLFATPPQIEELTQNYKTPGFGYGHAKLALLQRLTELTEAPRKIYDDYMAHPDTIEDILRDGAARASTKMNEVLHRARKAVGYR
ncbi:MAG: tryptophan--tRNA ligase [Proteobacteria bacterium]|nr:tryptophan--tRNA ligase [Pseudomonadota bacterium]